MASLLRRPCRRMSILRLIRTRALSALRARSGLGRLRSNLSRHTVPCRVLYRVPTAGEGSLTSTLRRSRQILMLDPTGIRSVGSRLLPLRASQAHGRQSR